MHIRLIRYSILMFVFLIAGAPASLAAGHTAQSPSQLDEAGLEQQNKTIVTRIYDEVLNQDNTATAYALFSTELLQHDQGAGDGPDGQLALFDNLRSNIPGVVATIKHIAADGDLVAVHWQASATPFSAAASRAARTRRGRCPARARHMALPMPVEAPVTTTTLPV